MFALSSEMSTFAAVFGNPAIKCPAGTNFDSSCLKCVYQRATYNDAGSRTPITKCKSDYLLIPGAMYTTCAETPKAGFTCAGATGSSCSKTSGKSSCSRI